MSRKILTCFFWPMRCARSCACRSTWCMCVCVYVCVCVCVCVCVYYGFQLVS